ncbi:MAG: MotA/TolQ/ExbB proton channel family protein [Spirochaetales bacterium]|nr:MotA/TolQ/ExbB proton channel family protein [Spirochaetales bacterium]
MLEIMNEGGIIMYFILLLSLIATVIIVERLLFFRRIRIDEDKMMNRLKSTLEKGHFDEALSICENNPSPVTNLMKVGIEHRRYENHIIKEVIMDAANLEIPKLEKFLSSLGTIAHIAPLLGLLGTVTGNIIAFGVLGKFGAVGDPGLLAKGISQALLTTAAGLIVAIPVIIFYNYLVNKVNHTIIRLENRVNELVLFLGSRKTEASLNEV